MIKLSSTHVISMCHIEHADVWKLTSQLLPLFVEADRYSVFVPDDQLAYFRSITGGGVEVGSELELDSGFTSGLREALSRAGNESRFGWYVQQFYKMEALRRSTAGRRVIWDADCVPLRPITLFGPAGRPTYMRSDEFHCEYFELIERWLGLRKVDPQSFIVPGFPVLGDWVADFFSYIEDRHSDVPWFESLLSVSDYSLEAGFSEFESLGAWISNRYVGLWGKSNYKWERFGQSKFGPAKDFSPETVRKIGADFDLDIVSFENWDKSRWKKRLANLFRLDRNS